MELKSFTDLVVVAVKTLPYLEKFLVKEAPEKVNGTWCICWENDKKFEKLQIGTLEIKQIGKKVFGNIYSTYEKWPFEGKNIDGVLDCHYIWSKDRKDPFELRYADEGNNYQRLVGSWSGPVVEVGDDDKSPKGGRVQKKYDLNMYATRGEGFCNKSCHVIDILGKKCFENDSKEIENN